MKLPIKLALAIQAVALVTLVSGIGARAATAATDHIQIAEGDGYGKDSGTTDRGRNGAGNGGTTNGSTMDRGGSAVDDSVITAKVKSALIADNEIKALDISVKTRKGEVWLSGNVDNQNQIDRAVQIASNVDGVKTVSNRLAVKK